jgi:hypothetical protein
MGVAHSTLSFESRDLCYIINMEHGLKKSENQGRVSILEMNR